MSREECKSNHSRGIRGPLLIVFEGIDGSGKSTQARMLADRLAREGTAVVLTCEPSDGPIGVRIRSFKARPGPEEEARLFTEDRRDHVERTIRPALRNGFVVICDRYIHSSMAYQGARGIDPKKILSENLKFAPPPDVIFLLLVSVDTALTRINASQRGSLSLFEVRESLERVDGIYRNLDDPAIRRLDGSLSPEENHTQVVEFLLALERNTHSAKLIANENTA